VGRNPILSPQLVVAFYTAGIFFSFSKKINAVARAQGGVGSIDLLCFSSSRMSLFRELDEAL